MFVEVPHTTHLTVPDIEDGLKPCVLQLHQVAGTVTSGEGPADGHAGLQHEAPPHRAAGATRVLEMSQP